MEIPENASNDDENVLTVTRWKLISTIPNRERRSSHEQLKILLFRFLEEILTCNTIDSNWIVKMVRGPLRLLSFYIPETFYFLLRRRSRCLNDFRAVFFSLDNDAIKEA